MSSSEPEGIEGVALPVYAAVRAGSAEGFPLEEVLAVEGISPKAWPVADLAWKQHLVADKANFERFQLELANAEDWLDRGVSPISADVAAWLAFLDAYAGHAEPFVLLERLDLGLNDMSRLKRIWDRKIAEDQSIPKRIAELRKKHLAPLPPLVVEPRALKRRRGAAPSEVVNRVQAAPAAAVSAAPQRGMSTGDLGLDLYASICAHYETRPKDLEQLRRFGIASEEQRLAMDARWQKEFTRDPTLHRDFRLLVAHEKRRLEGRDKNAARAPIPSPIREIAPVSIGVAPPIVASRGREHLQGTSLTLDVPRGPSLPFAIPKQGPVVIAPLVEPKPTRPPASPLAGTAMALEVPRGAALPFAKSQQEKQSLVGAPIAPERKDVKGESTPRQPSGLGSGTSFALATPRGPATPFLRAKEGEMSAPSAPTPPIAKSAGPRLGGTAMALDVPRGPDMPFPNATRPKKNALGNMASFELPKELRGRVGAPALEVRPSAPSAQPATPAPTPPAQTPPALTLEQHASLTLEIALSPHKTAELLARYRLNQESKDALDEHYRARMASEPGLRDGWNRAYTAYHTWLAKSPR